MAAFDYYHLLGLTPSASLEEIKKAFHASARRYHPDSRDGEANAEMFHLIKEAYEHLSDPDKRHKYDKVYFAKYANESNIKYQSKTKKNHSDTTDDDDDLDSNEIKTQYGKNDTQSNTGHGIWSFIKDIKKNPKTADKTTNNDSQSKLSATSGTHKTIGSQQPQVDNTKSTFAPPKSNVQKHWSDFLKQGPTQTKKQKNDVNNLLRGERVYVVSINALESIKGTTREIALRANEAVSKLQITLPSGIESGTILNVNANSSRSAIEEMIQVKVIVTPHPYVERSGNDIILIVPLTMAEALKGVELELPTCAESVRVKIPPVTERQAMLRLRGKGLKCQSFTGADVMGDLYVRTTIAAPHTSSNAAIFAAEALDVCYTKDVRADLPKKL